MTIKQVIVLRKDLNMRKGKMAAQAAHASMKVFFDRGVVSDGTLVVTMTYEMEEWVKGRFTKICLGCGSEQELKDLHVKALESGFPSALITDAGVTEFNGVPTLTALAIGPAESGMIDQITGHLTLL